MAETALQKKRRLKEEEDRRRREAAEDERTPFQKRLDLPAIDPRTAGGKPVIFKDRVVLPAKEDPALTARQAEEREKQDIKVAEEAKLSQLDILKEKQSKELEELRGKFLPDREGVIEELPITPLPQEFDEQGVPLLSGGVSSAEDVAQLLGPKGAGLFAAALIKTGVKKVAKRSLTKKTLPKVKKGLSKIGKFSKTIGGFFAVGGITAITGFLTTGKISELEGDINDLSGSTRDIVTDIVTRAGDPLEAIEAIEEIEEEIEFLSSQLKLVNSKWFNIVSRLTGKTVEPFIFRKLNQVIRRRQAIERFLITGDLNKLRILAEEDIQELGLETDIEPSGF